MSKVTRKYKITDVEGKVSVVNSLNAFASKVDVYYGQFYTALHKGTKTKKGGYKVEWYKESDVVVNTQSKTPDKVKSVVQEHTPPKGLRVLDVITEGNTYKIKFKSEEGKVHTHKVDIRRVNNLCGLKCNFSGHNIPQGRLYAICNSYGNERIFSVDQLKDLGFEVNINFNTDTKVVEKKIDVFSVEALEGQWVDKMELIIKEIGKVQKRLTKLKEAKELIGTNLSKAKQLNTNLSTADKVIEKLGL